MFLFCGVEFFVGHRDAMNGIPSIPLFGATQTSCLLKAADDKGTFKNYAWKIADEIDLYYFYK